MPIKLNLLKEIIITLKETLKPQNKEMDIKVSQKDLRI